MKGTVIERPAGSKQYCIRYSAGKDPATGKYRQIWESGFASAKEAKARLTELQYQRNRGTLPKPGKETVAEYLTRWIAGYGGNLSPYTTQGYRDLIRLYLAPAFSKTPLTQLGPQEIQAFYSAKLSSGLSSTTVNHIHTCLHKALRQAATWGLIPRNPADAGLVTPPRIRKIDMVTMAEDDVYRFLEAARSTDYHALFTTVLMTGARRGELLALRWSDVDLPRAEIHINRNVLRLKDHTLIYKAPKTRKGRPVALPPSTALLLRRHKEEREAQCATLGIPFEPGSLVFCKLDGSTLLPHSVSQAWRRLVTKTGLKHVAIHGGRHTHASLMLQAGIHPKVVQERLGHATISTTLDLYSHVAPGMQEAAAAKLDSILTKTPVEVNL